MNIIYAILDEPYCLWESDTRHAAQSFLKSIDCDYFHYVADRSVPDLNDEMHALRAATSMRLALFHGGETLFLLLGAVIQAPKCPHAWVGQASTSELRSVIDRISLGQPFLNQNSRIGTISWASLAKEVFAVFPRGAYDERAAENQFANFWERLSLNHTEQCFIDEYNSLKHGFRVSQGGFEVKIATHRAGSMPPPEDEMLSLGSSRWGASFRAIRKFENEANKTRSRQSILTSVNWDAVAVAVALRLVAESIRNVVAYLSFQSGLKGMAMSIPPADAFRTAERRSTLQSVSATTSNYAESTTKQQLMERLKRTAVRQLVSALRTVAAHRAHKLAN